MDEFDNLPAQVRELVHEFGDIAGRLYKQGNGVLDITEALRRLRYKASGRVLERVDPPIDLDKDRDRAFEVTDGNMDVLAFVASRTVAAHVTYWGPVIVEDATGRFWCVGFAETETDR